MWRRWIKRVAAVDLRRIMHDFRSALIMAWKVMGIQVSLITGFWSISSSCWQHAWPFWRRSSACFSFAVQDGASRDGCLVLLCVGQMIDAIRYARHIG